MGAWVVLMASDESLDRLAQSDLIVTHVMRGAEARRHDTLLNWHESTVARRT